jgi:DNA-binding NarL/FixJ family response regulator
MQPARFVPPSFLRLHSAVSRATDDGDVTYAAEGSGAAGAPVSTGVRTLGVRRVAGTAREIVYVTLPSEPHEMLSDGEVARLLRLSPRQAAVARLMARHLTNPQIAERLGITVSTTRKHVEMVLLRLGVSSRRQVAGILQERALQSLCA